MKQFLHFKTSNGRRLISVDHIVEVIPMVTLQREEANGNGNFCGLMNFRGNIVPVFSMSGEDQKSCLDPSLFLIVSFISNGYVAILANEVDYLLDVEDEDIGEISPANSEHFVVAKIDQEMVKVVNPGEFLV